MDYPYVPAYVDLGRARGPRRAVIWHMAEGGGTVAYLAKRNPNGVSVHFVIERSGRIVRMLGLARMQASIRTSDIRTTDDPAYPWQGESVRYGATAARAVLGPWATIRDNTLGPNHASIGVEVEGFARSGPNAAQADAIERLWRDLTGQFPGIRSLGHRDLADYKACPGKRFPWDRVGGHGPAPKEADMRQLAITATTPALITVTAGSPIVDVDGQTPIKVSPALTDRYSPYGAGRFRAIFLDAPRAQIGLVVAASTRPLPAPPDRSPFTQADLDAAIAADRARARIVYS